VVFFFYLALTRSHDIPSLSQINTVDQSIIDSQHKRLEELRTCSGSSCHTTPSGTPEIWL
jgi:hypothetical protein